MPRFEPPLIDRRTYGDIVAEVEELIRRYTPGVAPRADLLAGAILDQEIQDTEGGETILRGTRVDRGMAQRIENIEGLGPVKVQGWQPVPGQLDFGGALARIFGRMAELAVARLNRLPERNFLAFLDLIGTRLGPPQPARVPLTFLLAVGSPVDALVPAGTQAEAVALEGETEPPLFATERDLVVTRSQLVAVCSRIPGQDRWDDHTAIATGLAAGSFEAFRGGRPIDHRLYVDHPLLGLPEEKTIVLRMGLAANQTWPPNVLWSVWDGLAWQPLTPEASSLDLRFSRVPGAAAARVNGLDGHWLRGELRPGGGVLSQPSLNSVSVQVLIDGNGKTAPQPGFANQMPLDLSKDVLPFGEKPKIGDTFYLAGDEALSKPGAAVKLHVRLTNPSDSSAVPPPALSTSVMLAWECWNGREWQLLGNTGPGATLPDQEENPRNGLEDSTNAFLSEGTVGFVVPSGLAPVEAGGEMRHWLRVRIARGNYGVEARYEPVKPDPNGPTIYELVPATFQPPSLRALRLGYHYDSKPLNARRLMTENDFVFAEVTSESVFQPFVPSADSQPTLYLGFERPGDATGFANRATALFFQISSADPEAVIEEAAVAWEYWNGESWQRLGTVDETRGLTRTGLLTFLGPPNFRDSKELGRTAFWLRGRRVRGQYAVEPRLHRVLTNTMWAVHAETIVGEILGSGRAERGQVFHALRTPVLDGQALEVIEPELPSSADQAELETEEGDQAVAVLRDSAGQPAGVRVRWHEVPDFYGSGPRSRHYVLDHRTGEVRFGDGRRGLVPPLGRDNMRMARYQAGGGLSGNRPAGSIVQLKGTVPYVTGVAQLMASEGGTDAESLDSARTRGPRSLRHRGRATTAADFEDLAFQASPLVARARALPARHGSEGGTVRLIVVPVSEDARPVPGPELLARVRAYLESRLSPVVDVSVTGPDWLQLHVRAEIVPQQLDAGVDVQNAVAERLRAFLHPLSGGSHGDGWELGRKPYRSDLYALIEETLGVDHVRRLEVTEAAWDEARPDRFQIFSGAHAITVRGSVDDAASGSGSPA